MKLEYRAGMYVLGMLIVILLSIYTVDILYLTKIPAVAPFGFGMMVFFIILDAFLVVCEGKTPQVISNVGHFSINATKDIFDIPWQIDIKDDEFKNLNLLDTRIMLTGGIDYWGISIKSSSEKPVLISPSIYFEKEEKNYDAKASFELYDLDELPIYLQYYIKKQFPGRIKEKTPIYYSEVSHIDGTATPETMKILKKQRETNKEIQYYIDRNIRLIDDKEREDKHRRKFFIKKEIEEVKDEND